ncbi:hypothetical protein ASD02_16865 [Ensifer sp. Root1252]|nr:hypothetical protein ASD02_16865 [Ensifer sp. Root1252]KQY76987.1 hypothetical protein ASD52_23635 [Ensifer sp. Root142]KRC57218.1 hypothetical protein ASE32_20180 [Ensifer sp. Root231]KRC87713.1 hypothetical protein ASE47_14335 [Ensifer sp. Root258]
MVHVKRSTLSIFSVQIQQYQYRPENWYGPRKHSQSAVIMIYFCSRQSTDKEAAIRDVAGKAKQGSPGELKFLQGVFDRVCMWCDVARPSERADRLARFIMDEFHGTNDEVTLLAHTIWCEARQSRTRHRRGKLKVSA